MHKNAPPVSGVYGISNAREWIFIGTAEDIRATLLGHLAEQGTFLKSRAPTGFTYEICSPDVRVARQNWLVLEYEPTCNRKRGDG